VAKAAAGPRQILRDLPPKACKLISHCNVTKGVASHETKQLDQVKATTSNCGTHFAPDLLSARLRNRAGTRDRDTGHKGARPAKPGETASASSPGSCGQSEPMPSLARTVREHACGGRKPAAQEARHCSICCDVESCEYRPHEPTVYPLSRPRRSDSGDYCFSRRAKRREVQQRPMGRVRISIGSVRSPT